MIVSELIGKIHIAYKGKAAVNAPAVGDEKYSMYLSRANDNQDRWAEDPAIDNPDLFGGDIILTLTAGAAALPANVARPTDPVMYGDDIIPLVSYKERHIASVGAYVVGPKGNRKLYVINPDKYPNNSFTVGVIQYPTPLTDPSDTVTCTMERWLVLQTAAQLAEVDPAQDDLAPSLFNQAIAEYTEGLQRIKKQLRGTARKVKIVRHPSVGGL